MTRARFLSRIKAMSFTVRPVREERKSSAKKRKALLISITIFESLLHLYRRMKNRKEEEKLDAKRVHVLKRTVTILIGLLLALLLVVGTLKILVRLKAISLSGMMSAVSATLPTDEQGFTNVLLLGAGDEDHDGVDLTDTMMIASLDPSRTKSVVLLSLPRDLYVLNTAKMGKGRINSLYRDYKDALIHKGMEKNAASEASLAQLGEEIGNLIHLPIHGVVKIDFSGFEQMIDAIGGVDVVVPEDLVDPEYPGPGYSYETFSISSGPHHLSGATALKYVRSRHSTSDFSRSARQQQIIEAAQAKVRAAGLLTNAGRMTELLSIISKHMASTLQTRELLGLAEMGKKIDLKNVVSMQLSDQSGLYGGAVERGGFLYAPPREQFDGAAVLLPVSIPEFPVTWKQLQALSELLFKNRELFMRPPTIAVLNAGAKQGLARKLSGELYRYGFNVSASRNYARKKNPSFDHSFIAINPALAGKGPNAPAAGTSERATMSLKALKKLFGTGDPPSPLDTAPFTDGNPDIIIVIGKDFSFSPIQDLLQ